MTAAETGSEADGTATVNADPALTAPRKASGHKRVILIGVVALAAAGLGTWIFTHRGLESTDDAQIDGEVVAVAPRTSGVVVKVNFNDNERVEKGHVLAELDPEPAKAMLAQAEASLEGAKAAAAAAATDALLATTNAKATNHAASASLSAASAGASASRDQIAEARTRVTSTESARAQAKTDLDRMARLVGSGSLPAAQLESAKTAFDTAEANVAQARAHLSGLESSAAQAMSHVGEASAKVEQTRDIDSVVALAEARSRGARAKVAELEAARDRAALELSYTKIVAAQDGIASKKNIAVGQTISAGSPFAQLVSIKEVWVTANFKETQVTEMHVGQSVDLRVDAFSGPALHGTVESFSAATGSRFALLPPDNASGNFTKVVQRIPVRIRIDGAPEVLVLRPGMSVELTVNTRK